MSHNMNLLRSQPVNVDEQVDDIEFQIVQWVAEDVEYEEAEDGDGYEDASKYVIKMYGVTKEGYSVSLNVLDFTPYFMIKVNRPVSKIFLQRIQEHVISSLPFRLRGSLVGVKVLKKKDFYGFHNHEQFTFLRFAFKSLKGFRAGIRIFQKEVRITGMDNRGVKYRLYESNIEPFLRFMHIRNISPTGWVRMNAKTYEVNDSVLPTTCQIDINSDWKVVNALERERLAPMIVASFDLECTSSHGDFPVARKDYRKVAFEMMQAYNDESIVSTSDIIEELPKIFLHDVPGKLSKVFIKDSGLYVARTELVERLTLKVKQCVDDLQTILKGKMIWREGKYMPVPVATKDEIVKTLTCKLGTRIEDSWNGIFPQLEGDSIIQVGTTVHNYGETECSFKHIITLGTCEPIDGVVVEVCETERELLLKWQKLIKALDPDVITGYNIFGFDMSYMYDRACELGVEASFCKLGKIADKSCEYKEKTLSSSALGDNLLKFIDMDGRVLIDIMKVVQRDHKLDSYKLDNVANHFMKMNKNDVSPNDIFRLQKGTAEDRKMIAEYCVQDCALCNKLMMKLEILANNIGMSNVCNVPLSYIFMRGQGVKIFSLVSKQCREEDFMIPTISKPFNPTEEELEDEDGYEGAIVLEPKQGIYLDDPVSVLDYASLYPSSMISENLSHDCIVMDPKYDNLPGVEYLDISYDIYEGLGDKKAKVGEKVCRFVQFPNNEKGVIPRILMKLLKARKDTRKKIEFQTVTLTDGTKYSGMVKEDGDTLKIAYLSGDPTVVPRACVLSMEETYGEFEKAVLDGLQVAYKVTANSLYGQIGAKTSPIYMKEIAACTTATGRKMITLARDYMLETYPGTDIIYGDTDSIFVKFPIKRSEDEELTNAEKIKRAWDMGVDASSRFKKLIKNPHDLEMEKVMFPFILFSKKRYCAYKYEGAEAKPKMNSMGIVLKRRDNANIVKKVYGGIIDIIMNDHDVQKSVDFLKENLETFVGGKYPLEDLVITKSLKAEYKDPSRIAHKVLAERMGERDPGNKPQVNDRIPFVYVQTNPLKKGEKLLQGNRIEHPNFIRQNNLKPDYEFYITNQIMKPVLQLYALILEDLEGYRKGRSYFDDVMTKLVKDKNGDVKKAKERWQDLREDEVKKIMFDPILNKVNNMKCGNRMITDFFRKT
jgi:DNA polymerase delta subunit 1